jgi:hypothetical protein
MTLAFSRKKNGVHFKQLRPTESGRAQSIRTDKLRKRSARVSLIRQLRCTLVLSALFLTFTQTGCQVFQRFGARPDPVPVVFNEMPPQEQLIATLNSNSSRVRQLQSSISLSMDGIPKIKGSLQLERPDRIRIKAGLMGISELGVDVGSNSERFWVWSKAATPGQTPAIFFARHEDFRNRLAQMPLPLEPQWIIDAAGLVEFAPGEVHQGPFPVSGGKLKLISVRQTPSGPLTRVSLIDAKSAQIYQQAIYDASNRLIAYTNSSSYRYYADQQVSLPHWIELHVFAPDGQEIKLVVEAGDYRINSLHGDPDKMWTMPTPAGVSTVNLAQVSNQ